MWAARAKRLGEILPRERLHPGVVAWADSRPASEKWAVALSGGPDSVCLLLLLAAHWPARKRRLRALHFNHRLRGAAARADAAFCRRLCRALGVAYAGGSWSGGGPRAGEAAARNARFEFLEREMAAHRIGVLWLGHQQDDVAETLLMRVARGSGTGGLAAPRPLQPSRSGMRGRPLLSLKKTEILDALRRAGVPWREDATNRGGDHFRNRIRNQVLRPWIDASGRDALAGAALSRELLEEDDCALESWADASRSLTPGGRVNLARLRGLPTAVVRRVLHRWLLAQPLAGDLSRQGFAGLLAAVIRGRPARQSLGAQGFAVVRGGWLRFSKIRKNLQPNAGC